MANLASNLPVLNIPFVDANNNLSVPWLMFLVQMYQRTGGDQTPPLNLTQVQQQYLQTVNILSANGFAGNIVYTTTNADITLSTTVTGLVKGNGTALSAATSGTDYSLPVLVSSANGFAGTVVNGTSNATVTMKTTITGLLKGNGTAISAAVSGTDYAPATSGTSILYGNGAGGFSNVTIGSGVSFVSGTLSATGSGGTITSVTGTAPISSSGGTTPNISITQSSATTSGYLSSTDWNTFNNKQPSGTYVTSVTATSPVLSSGGTTPNISMGAASSSTSGYLTSTDWTTFNNKGSGTVTSVSGTGSVNGITLTGTVTSSGSLTLGGTLGGIANSQLTNSTISGISLGSNLASLTIGTGLSGTSYNGSTAITIANTGVLSVTGTSPVSASTTSGATTVSLSSGYGDTQNPYASKTANYVLASPNGSAGVPSFRSLVNADLPSSGVTSGTYGSASVIPVLTVNSQGIVTSISTQATNAPSYQGVWNASTNTPTLTSSVGTAGYYYVVSVAGNTTLNGVSGWNVGDWAIFENSVWQKIPGSTSESFTNLTTTNLAVTGLTGYMYANNTTGNVTASTTIPTTALSGTITNAQLANSTISGVSLGSNLFSLTAGTGVSFSSGTTYNGSAAITINATGSGGTVTSVAATVPSFLSISGSPITTNGTLAITYSGTALPAVNGGTAQTSYTTGDILYASASNTLSKLAIGTTGYTLTVASGVPTWKPPYVRTSFTATASQTTFTATYNVGYVQVFVNGVLLNGTDYTATNGTSVILGVGCNAGDIVETIAYNV